MRNLFWCFLTGMALSVTMMGFGLACLYLSSGSDGYIAMQAVALQLWFVDRYAVFCVALLNAYFIYSLNDKYNKQDAAETFLKKSE